MANDAVLAFCSSAVLLGKPDTIDLLEETLLAKWGQNFLGAQVFSFWRDDSSTTLAGLDQTVAKSIALLRKGDHIEPRDIYGIGLRMFEKSGQSNFKRILVPRIAAWFRGEWAKIVAQESFRLSRPTQTMPAIGAALSQNGNDESFVARLLLEASDAVSVNLAAPYRNYLMSITDEKAPS